jgi:hypothetical protein
MIVAAVASVVLLVTMFAAFCKRHQISYHDGSQCPTCTENEAKRPYRGMNKSVLVDTSVVRYRPARQDAKNTAMLTRDR